MNRRCLRTILIVQLIALPAVSSAEPRSGSRSNNSPLLPFSSPEPTSSPFSPPSPRPSVSPHDFPSPKPWPTALPTAQPTSGGGSNGGSNTGSAIIGAVVGAALAGLGGAGALPAGGNGNVGGSGPTGPNAGGIQEGSEADLKFNPNKSKQVVDEDEEERKTEKEECKLECPAEEPGSKGNPEDEAIGPETEMHALQAGDQSSQGAVDIANAIGAAPPTIHTSASSFLNAVTAASADGSGQSYAFFINSHGAGNGGLQAGTSAQDIANAWAQGGGKNSNTTIIHSECYAGEHTSQIAYSLEEKGFDASQRPNQIYSRPAYCQNYGNLNGEQLHQGGYSLLDQAILNSVTPGQPLTLGQINAAAQGLSKPGYTTWIKRVAPKGKLK